MRLVFFWLLVLAVVPAWAAWERVGADENAVFYIDLATLRKDGSFVRTWLISELKKPAPKGEVSRRALFEYDCKERRYRILSISSYSGSMARGNTISIDNFPDPWREVPLGTVSEDILVIVCP